jgi:hypothetical protein
MDVGEWLNGIGLGQYEATFRAHDIDVDVLADVTEAELGRTLRDLRKEVFQTWRAATAA